jgi:hypothetical protein
MNICIRVPIFEMNKPKMQYKSRHYLRGSIVNIVSKLIGKCVENPIMFSITMLKEYSFNTDTNDLIFGHIYCLVFFQIIFCKEAGNLFLLTVFNILIHCIICSMLTVGLSVACVTCIYRYKFSFSQ